MFFVSFAVFFFFFCGFKIEFENILMVFFFSILNEIFNKNVELIFFENVIRMFL